MPLLFSYGSNSPRQLGERLGREVEGWAAYLPDYRRVFRGWSNGWQSGVASLEKKRGEKVYGYCEEVTDEELKTLDRYEGVASGKYKRVTVHPRAATGGPEQPAVAYVSTSTRFYEPSREYLKAVAETISAFWDEDGKAVTWKDIRVNPTSPPVACRNPKIGEHLDLFERTPEGGPAMTDVWAPLEGFETFTESQLKAMPRSAFSDDEFERLPEEIQEHIHEEDPESAARIKNLVDVFVIPWKAAEDPLGEYGIGKDVLIDSEHEYFEMWLADHADDLASLAERDDGDNYEELAAEMREAFPGLREDDFDATLNEALQDNNNYDFDITTGYGQRFFWSEIRTIRTSMYVDQDDIDKAGEDMYPDEIEAAFKQINKETYLHIDEDVFSKKYGLEVYDIDTGLHFVADIDWTKVGEAVREKLQETFEPQAEALPEDPEERIVHRFKDGFYVIRLLPGELPDEGKKQGICVGQARFGYAKAVRDGHAAIYSLRRPSGKPLFTIEAALTPSGEITKIVQVKGKANRLPGWDLGKEGRGDLKRDEVEKILEWLQSGLGLDDIEVASISDMRPALEKLKALPPKKNPKSRSLNPDRPLGFDSPWRP